MAPLGNAARGLGAVGAPRHLPIVWELKQLEPSPQEPGAWWPWGARGRALCRLSQGGRIEAGLGAAGTGPAVSETRPSGATRGPPGSAGDRAGGRGGFVDGGEESGVPPERGSSASP